MERDPGMGADRPRFLVRLVTPAIRVSCDPLLKAEDVTHAGM